MRSHVFPVCRPSFNKLDVETIDESRSLLAGISGNNIYYKTTGSDGVQGFANFNIAGEKIVRIDFVVDGDGGEYLLGDISNPSEITILEPLPFGFVHARNLKNSSNELILNRLYITDIQDYSLSAGSVFCFGSKPSTDVTIYRNAPQVGINELDSYITPLDDMTGFSPTMQGVDGNIWFTYMFTGTHFVLLGSNNWVS